jgi:hypothetical protein
MVSTPGVVFVSLDAVAMAPRVVDARPVVVVETALNATSSMIAMLRDECGGILWREQCFCNYVKNIYIVSIECPLLDAAEHPAISGSTPPTGGAEGECRSRLQRLC